MENNEQYEKDWGWVLDIKPGLKHLEEEYFVDGVNESKLMIFHFTAPLTPWLIEDKIMPVVRSTYPDVRSTYPDVTTNLINTQIIDPNFIMLQKDKRGMYSIVLITRIECVNLMTKKWVKGDNYFGLNS